ncbi:prepilin-type N-terminal cleavage/methylation domain-containing protein [Acinetobacter sp. R933-2]|uniref:type IV pilin protein n=1 Tax=Acinetobacter TaxID=469 RepID=UPI002578C619|nr:MULTISPECIES: type IV pilin protein [Acinetobacter]MDM1246062.1 prepilin-type N-terminal cleavage/methylation domain-containing protein [Acinetobacter sp. R933-2]MDQ9020622.1 type IV pilin protein [Acinetobacter sichuanensis]
MKKNSSFQNGFTLIEVMVVVVIVAIFAAIAIPSYQEYARRAQAAQVQDQLQQIAIALDRYKTRNFNYQGFVLPVEMEVSPKGATGSAIRYNLSVATGVGHQSWVITALAEDTKSDNFLMSSTGIRCKNKAGNLIDVTEVSCGDKSVGREEW